MTKITIDVDPELLDQIVVDALKDALDTCEILQTFNKKDEKANRKIEKHLRKVIKYFSVIE